jgi:replicative DNA helicase
MIIQNTTPMQQAIGWICLNSTFLYIPDSYFSGDYLECYMAIKKQYEATGKIEVSILPTKLLDIALKSDEIAFPKNYEPIIDALSKEFRRLQAWAAICELGKKLKTSVDCDEFIVSHNEKMVKVMQEYKVSEYKHDISVSKFTDMVDERKNSPGLLKGLPSSMPDLDKTIRGWQHGKLYAVGGLKKTGKSRFVINLMSFWLSMGKKGIIFSMEMNENDIHSCIVGNRHNINTSLIGTSEINEQQVAIIHAEADNYKRQGLIIDRTSAVKIINVKNQILKAKDSGSIDFVIVDYIQRMSGEGEKRVNQIEGCITRLADIARDENVIMIVLSQLSGAAEHKTDSPIYSFFKESQAIIEACDCALVLFDEKRGEEKADVGHEIKCTILQRDGVSDYSIPLWAELKYSKFSNMEKNINEEKKTYRTDY